ncbi:hypothetical protein M885DRAFT_587731 [Pelagophyceae sp. CCMP2097]|nr:hypothetical protein M885DRAFT_587731 [Pelagophyceae sp. CCMP2097]
MKSSVDDGEALELQQRRYAPPKPPRPSDKALRQGCQVCGLDAAFEDDEILYCDGGCDRAFHQSCYHVPDIPEGDWACRACLKRKGEDIPQSMMPRPPSVASTEEDDLLDKLLDSSGLKKSVDFAVVAAMTSFFCQPCLPLRDLVEALSGPVVSPAPGATGALEGIVASLLARGKMRPKKYKTWCLDMAHALAGADFHAEAAAIFPDVRPSDDNDDQDDAPEGQGASERGGDEAAEAAADEADKAGEAAEAAEAAEADKVEADKAEAEADVDVPDEGKFAKEEEAALRNFDEQKPAQRARTLRCICEVALCHSACANPSVVGKRARSVFEMDFKGKARDFLTLDSIAMDKDEREYRLVEDASGAALLCRSPGHEKLAKSWSRAAPAATPWRLASRRGTFWETVAVGTCQIWAVIEGLMCSRHHADLWLAYVLRTEVMPHLAQKVDALANEQRKLERAVRRFAPPRKHSTRLRTQPQPLAMPEAPRERPANAGLLEEHQGRTRSRRTAAH